MNIDKAELLIDALREKSRRIEELEHCLQSIISDILITIFNDLHYPSSQIWYAEEKSNPEGAPRRIFSRRGSADMVTYAKKKKKKGFLKNC